MKLSSHLKLSVAALVGALVLSGGAALATAGASDVASSGRAGTCQAEKQDVKKAKKELKNADSGDERKEAKRDVKAAKKRLKDCKSSASPTASPTSTETPTDPPTEGGGTCVPVAEICVPGKSN